MIRNLEVKVNSLLKTLPLISHRILKKITSKPKEPKIFEKAAPL